MKKVPKIGDKITVSKRLMQKKNFVGKIKDIKQMFGVTQIILEDVKLADDLTIRLEK